MFIASLGPTFDFTVRTGFKQQLSAKGRSTGSSGSSLAAFWGALGLCGPSFRGEQQPVGGEGRWEGRAKCPVLLLFEMNPFPREGP